MWGRSTPIAEAALRRLHPECIEDPGRIQSLLQRACDERVVFYRGLNAYVDLEVAYLKKVGLESLIFEAPDFDARTINGQLFLNFTVGGKPYLFSVWSLRPFESGRLELPFPDRIYFGERRDRRRQSIDSESGEAWRVQLSDDQGGTRFGRVQNMSESGMGILVEGNPFVESSQPLKVRFLDGPEEGTERKLQLRHQGEVDGRNGWLRIGLAQVGGSAADPIRVEYRDEILDGPDPIAESSVAEPVPSHELRVDDERGEKISTLIDTWGDSGPSTGVVLPNGWGQTKEALLPLAHTLIATFREAGERVAVLRYDGIRRRGQSHNDPECLLPGRSDENFVFSQAVHDLETVVSHLRGDTELNVSRLIIVSFSAAAIEVRRALARDRGSLIDGWVSVVGSPDLQSMTRAISGGVDLVGGVERGLSFGKQELLGVVVDIDRIGADAAQNSMSFLEDSRRDMAEIKVPVSWFHGRYDAWVDLSRVQDILSHGETENRKLVVIPTGHQLRTSLQARRAFASISCEVARIAKGKEVAPTFPSGSDQRKLRSIEGRRVPREDTDLHSFWRDYLIGRDRSLGIELLTSSSAYRTMMWTQLEAMSLESGQSVVDLGSGTGAFTSMLLEVADRPSSLTIINVDYVKEALMRGRSRVASMTDFHELRVEQIEVDLNLSRGREHIPLASESQDRVLASLVLSYLEHPEELLSEIYRILRPGGQVVLSSLCRDADISRLYFEAYGELQSGAAGQDLPELKGADLSQMARSFLNDAAKIIEFEDLGAFRFWDPDEFSAWVETAGFHIKKVEKSLGHPPQAVVLSAIRP